MKHPMPEAPTSTFDNAIDSYVQRGIFRNVKEVEDEGVRVFHIAWLSEIQRITLAYDPTNRVVSFDRLLPALPGDVMAHVERKVAKRTDPQARVPDHRRITPGLGTLTVVREDGDATLRFDMGTEVGDAQALVLLVEVANNLIFDLQLRFPAYTYEHFAQLDE